MAQKRISRFPLNENFSGLRGHVPNYGSMLCVTISNCSDSHFHSTYLVTVSRESAGSLEAETLWRVTLALQTEKNWHVRYYLRRHPLPAIFAHTSPQLFATINNETSWEV